jgi:hypothetical protein
MKTCIELEISSKVSPLKDLAGMLLGWIISESDNNAGARGTEVVKELKELLLSNS